ncbi:CoA transferase [Nocardioides sp. BP30]|uniref:CaiB/BaiF CoA transferase family protein n=1 Tax=Nocardioides sp. BP30 TaxID=3036374 RepID=UPI0024699478|nr:CoA transferase [Nocardioides sp. BP30]WGL54025.1 CoA transferase [Nocardioides sp. BP30]
MTDQGPLHGLRIVDITTTLPGAMYAQFLADAGADVITVEPPGGSPVRELPGWPGLLRGRRSIVLDLREAADLDVLRGLLAQSDVLVHGLRPHAAREFGLDRDTLTASYPRLVAAHITGFGSDGPWSEYKGYEALVLAKTGVMHNKRQLTRRKGPAYVSVPYASWAAAHNALHGTLAALHEREQSGRGQVIETNLVQGIGSMDTYNWFYEMIIDRYPGAYEPADLAYDEDLRPSAPLLYALLIAPTKDGVWLQFAQTAPRLMMAWIAELGIGPLLQEERFKGFPVIETVEAREELWMEMIKRVGQRTLAEWQETFERNPDVSAEIFRTPEGAFQHPQVVFEGRAIEVDQPGVGKVVMPAPQVYVAGHPVTDVRPAPAVGEHDAELRALAAQAAPAAEVPDEAPVRLPLQDVTIVEFGTMFAGPYGATLLTDHGARVIKVEELGGDNIRMLVPFPEAGGAKVLQGKESLAIDAGSPEGREIISAIVAKADVVLQCMRSGAAERLGVDEESARALNPDIVYVNSFGYGHDGPFAKRPAYAPSIGSSSGIADIDSRGKTMPPQSEQELREGSVTLHSAHAVPAAQADGISAVGVASTIMLGLYARDRGVRMDAMTTTMMGSALNCLNYINNVYDDRVEMPQVDAEFFGLSALYRLYPAQDGFVFLAAPREPEWDDLVTALKPYVDLTADSRFATAASRQQHDAELAEVLGGVFASRAKADWEAELTKQDVGLVAVVEANSEKVLQGDDFYEAGFAVDAVSPIFDEHRRLAPMVRFSRSLTQAPAGCTIGQHTDTILTEFGFGDRIAALREAKVVG